MNKVSLSVLHSRSLPIKMQWILNSLQETHFHLKMNNLPQGTGKELTQEALTESLSHSSHQLVNHNKISTKIIVTYNHRTSQLTSIIILLNQSLTWSTRTQTWSSRFKTSLFLLQTQMELVRRSSNPSLTTIVRIENEVTWPQSSRPTSLEGQWLHKTSTSPSPRPLWGLFLPGGSSFTGWPRLVTSLSSLWGMREGLELPFLRIGKRISVEQSISPFRLVEIALEPSTRVSPALVESQEEEFQKVCSRARVSQKICSHLLLKIKVSQVYLKT